MDLNSRIWQGPGSTFQIKQLLQGIPATGQLSGVSNNKKVGRQDRKDPGGRIGQEYESGPTGSRGICVWDPAPGGPVGFHSSKKHCHSRPGRLVRTGPRCILCPLLLSFAAVLIMASMTPFKFCRLWVFRTLRPGPGSPESPGRQF